MISAKQIRRQIRMLRSSMSLSESQRAAYSMAERAAVLESFTAARHIAGYIAVNLEMDPAPLLELALARGKSVYLPVLQSKQEPMVFAPYRPGAVVLKPNRFGIPEPDVPSEQMLPPQSLDLVLTPLVAFDSHCNRLGMGGGFYDRTFAFVKDHRSSEKPYLLGLGYEIQKVPELICEPWDIALDGIVTEAAFYCASKRLRN